MPRQLSPPTIHNLARSWRETPEGVARELVALYRGKPPFNYSLLTELVRYALKGELSERQFREAVLQRERRKKIQKIFLEVIPHLWEHFSRLNPRYILPADPGRYVISKDISIPFKPAMMFEDRGELIIPWYIFWKINPLTHKQLSLFTSLAFELIERNPDTEDARLVIYDFSAPQKGEGRSLSVLDCSDIDRLSATERDASLEVWVDGYQMAQQMIAELPERASDNDARVRRSPNQIHLFPDE